MIIEAFRVARKRDLLVSSRRRWRRDDTGFPALTGWATSLSPPRQGAENQHRMQYGRARCWDSGNDRSMGEWRAGGHRVIVMRPAWGTGSPGRDVPLHRRPFALYTMIGWLSNFGGGIVVTCLLEKCCGCIYCASHRLHAYGAIRMNFTCLFRGFRFAILGNNFSFHYSVYEEKFL